MIALSNIAQGSAVLAMIYLQRNNAKAKEVSIPACISCYLGVTEPALFGVNLKYTFPFVCGMTGSAIAAMISVSTGTMAASIGVGGLPGILSILPKYWLTFFIAMVVAIVVPFILTVVVGKKKLSDVELNGVKKDKKDFVSPMKGKLLPLSKVEDQVFSQGLMGQGFAVELEDSKVVAPFSGEIVMTFPTKHAYGIKREDGLEVLIHIGMDTVQLNGEGFECLVEKGDFVKQGDILAIVDLDYIRQHGKSLVSPVVITSGQSINLVENEKINQNEFVITLG